jgi:hypothetical protein
MYVIILHILPYNFLHVTSTFDASALPKEAGVLIIG